jgi:hypothetical protein
MPSRSEPTAAQALYGHLPSAARPEVKQRPGSLAEALYPALAPKPSPAPKRHREEVPLATLCDADPWLEWRLAMVGIRRVRR